MTAPIKPNESPEPLAGQSLGAAPGSATIDIELYKNVRHQYDLRLQEIESLRAALEEIRKMAPARKSCLRMPDGRMLDTFCRHALSPNDPSSATASAARVERTMRSQPPATLERTAQRPFAAAHG